MVYIIIMVKFILQDTKSTTKKIKSYVAKDPVIELANKFDEEIMRCVNCPILMQCKHSKHKLKPLEADAKTISNDIYEEEIEMDESAENLLRAQMKRDASYKEYIQARAYDILKDERCIFEGREVISTIEKFTNSGYDLGDPRAFLIISELIGNLLNSGRANKAFTALGVILKKETPAGPVYYENPLLKTKMMFSKLIVEATEALDRILKSDEQVKSDKSFTDHLLTNLKLRKQQELDAVRKSAFNYQLEQGAKVLKVPEDAKEL